MSRVLAAPPDPDPLRSVEELYARNNLLKVELFMKEDAWDRLRFSWRGEEEREQDGKWTTIKSDYHREPGDVVINGVRVAKVGIRKKGYIGSVSAQRPGLKIKFDEYVKGQKFLGQEDLTLNNNAQDPTCIRQWLAYEWFRRAGIAAPRCNLARVYVNGRYFGIYSSVEPVDKGFLKENFGSAKGTLFESNEYDFRTRAVEQFDIKSHNDTADRSPLRKVARLLEDLEKVDMTELSKVVDLEQFLKFWVSEMLLGHWDGYFGSANNFLVYNNPKSGRLEFIPWGTDQAFGGLNLSIAEKAPMIIHGRGRLSAALYSNPAYRDRYLKLVARQLEQWWNAPALLAEVERASKLIRPYLLMRPADFDEALSDLRQKIAEVAPRVTTELKDPPARWLVPAAADYVAEQRGRAAWAGSVNGTFLIPYGTYIPTNQTVLKDSKLNMVWRGKPVDHPVLTGTAGFKRPGALWYETPEMAFSFVAPETGRLVWVYMSIDPELLAKGAKLKLQKGQVVCWFGTALAGKPDITFYGEVEGVAEAALVDVGGARYLKGTIDGRLYSDLDELKF